MASQRFADYVDDDDMDDGAVAARPAEDFHSRRRLDFSNIGVDKSVLNSSVENRLVLPSGRRLTERQQMALILKGGSIDDLPKPFEFPSLSDESEEEEAAQVPSSSASTAQRGSQKKRRRGGKDKEADEFDADDANEDENTPSNKPAEFKSWSDAKQKAYEAIEKNPNSYYYRNTHPGVKQCFGKWTEEQHHLFMRTLRKHHPTSGQWGVFASHMIESGRVGYQCRNYYHHLLSHGLLKDEDYMDAKGNCTKNKKRTADAKQEEEPVGEEAAASSKPAKKRARSSSKGKGDAKQFMMTPPPSDGIVNSSSAVNSPAPLPFEIPSFRDVQQNLDDDCQTPSLIGSPQHRKSVSFSFVVGTSSSPGRVPATSSSPVRGGNALSYQALSSSPSRVPGSSSPTRRIIRSSSPPARNGMDDVEPIEPTTALPPMRAVDILLSSSPLRVPSEEEPVVPVPVLAAADLATPIDWSDDPNTAQIVITKRRSLRQQARQTANAAEKAFLEQQRKQLLVPSLPASSSEEEEDEGDNEIDVEKVVEELPKLPSVVELRNQRLVAVKGELLNIDAFITSKPLAQVRSPFRSIFGGNAAGSDDEVDIVGSPKPQQSTYNQRWKFAVESHRAQKERLLVVFESELIRTLANFVQAQPQQVVDSEQAKSVLLSVVDEFETLQDAMLLRHAHELMCLPQQQQQLRRQQDDGVDNDVDDHAQLRLRLKFLQPATL